MFNEIIEFLPLVAVVIVVVGFMLKWDPLGIVVIAGIFAGLSTNFSSVSSENLSFIEVVAMLGKNFTSNRIVSIFIFTLPVIVLAERYGLKAEASKQIKKLNGLPTGKFLTIYGVIRSIIAAVGLKLGGHVQLTKPLIEPMAQAAESIVNSDVDEKRIDDIKAASSSVENYANFFSQNLFLASSGVILIATTLISNGVLVSETLTDLEFQSEVQRLVSLYSIPISVISIIVFAIQYKKLDKDKK